MGLHRHVASWVLVALLAATSVSTAEAAVVCARPRAGGLFDTVLKIREACRSREVRIGVIQLDPLVVGAQPATTTTTSTSSTTVSTGIGTTSTTTSTTLPAGSVCGNGIVEPGEVCDCAGGPSACQPYPDIGGLFNQGGCPQAGDGRFQMCASDCSACLPTPVCGDGVYDPGDTCDYAYGTPNDQCLGTSRCTLTAPCRCFP